ncbi:response regulator [Paenibacillaceae bacterium]|nr:response regulator [Paenibacillaceae bacterium]
MSERTRGIAMIRRVVVIDDKPLIRRAIVQTVDWHAVGCEIVGEAEDGIEGKQVIADTRPDILITDIKMPGLSGLDLAEWMHAYLPTSKTILITGYQDFAYAQRAVRLGVFDFIVKPVKNDELQNTIRSAVEELNQQAEDKYELAAIEAAFATLSEQHQHSLTSLRSKFATDLIEGGAGDEQKVAETAARLGLQYAQCAVVIVRAKPAAGHSARFSDLLIDVAVQEAAKREFNLIEAYRKDHFIFICLFDKPLSLRELRMKLQSFSRELISQTKNPLHAVCTVAVSAVRKSLYEAGEAYQEASLLMESRFFGASDAVLLADSAETGKEKNKFSIIEDLEKFNETLKHGTKTDIITHMESMLEQIKRYSEGNILVVKGLLSEVCLAALRYYYRVTGNEFGSGQSVDQTLEDVYRLGSLKEAADYLTAFITKIRNGISGGEKEYSLVVRKALDYINANFTDNINLTAVADYLGISPSYLSRLLSTETGTNFVDFVARARIEAAKRLLLDPKNKVNEVGEMVGYKEYAYFYQVFKKVTGISPKEFKNQSKEI